MSIILGAGQLPLWVSDVKYAEEAILELSYRGIKDGVLADFGRALAVLSLYTDIAPEEILRICKDPFDGSKYRSDGGISAPIGQIGQKEPAEIVRHWLSYWGVLAVLCDEGSTTTNGLPWLSDCMINSCIRRNLIQLPTEFQATS
jgi:hypothetical protein